MTIPDISNKMMLVKKFIEYAEKWNLEDHGYACMYDDGRIVPTNNLDCDGLRYFNHISFLKHINNVMKKELAYRDMVIAEKDKEIERLKQSDERAHKLIHQYSDDCERLEDELKILKRDYDKLYYENVDKLGWWRAEVERLEGIVFELVKKRPYMSKAKAKAYCLKSYGIEVEI